MLLCGCLHVGASMWVLPYECPRALTLPFGRVFLLIDVYKPIFGCFLSGRHFRTAMRGTFVRNRECWQCESHLGVKQGFGAQFERSDKSFALIQSFSRCLSLKTELQKTIFCPSITFALPKDRSWKLFVSVGSAKVITEAISGLHQRRERLGPGATRKLMSESGGVTPGSHHANPKERPAANAAVSKPFGGRYSRRQALHGSL